MAEEFQSYSVEQIAEKFIDKDIYINQIPMYPGRTNAEHLQGQTNAMHLKGQTSGDAIIGDNVESKIPGEGVVTFDIRFKVSVPNGKKQAIKLFVNIEAQKKYYQKYALVIPFRCIGSKKRTLKVLLSQKLSVDEKKHILTSEFGIKMDDGLRKELEHMCNFGEVIEARAMRKGRRQGMRKGRRQGEERMGQLVQLLMDENRYPDVSRVVKDLEYRRQLYEAYGI